MHSVRSGITASEGADTHMRRERPTVKYITYYGIVWPRKAYAEQRHEQGHEEGLLAHGHEEQHCKERYGLEVLDQVRFQEAVIVETARDRAPITRCRVSAPCWGLGYGPSPPPPSRFLREWCGSPISNARLDSLRPRRYGTASAGSSSRPRCTIGSRRARESTPGESGQTEILQRLRYPMGGSDS